MRSLIDTDWPSIAEICARTHPDRPDADELRRRAILDAGSWEERFVAQDPDGRVTAYARSGRRVHYPAGQHHANVQVAEGHEGHGLGQALLRHVESLVEDAASSIVCTLRENMPRAVTFAERNGYVLDQRLFESTLDLTRWIESEHVEADIVSFAEIGDREEHRRKLYAVYSAAEADSVDVDSWGISTYEQFLRDEVENAAGEIAGILIARDGDQWIGLHTIHRGKGGQYEVDYTGVVPSHRGQGIGYAMKTAGAAWAKSLGATSLTTNNDSRNAPILRINEKMGFVAKPGWAYMRKTLSKN
jgi:GNAT superfamily N-acetyltransferase